MPSRCASIPTSRSRSRVTATNVGRWSTTRRSVSGVRMRLETRTELAQQRDILLSTRATAGSTTKDLYEQMSRLEGKLDEVMNRFQQVQARSSTPVTPGGPDPNSIYDQAMQDLAQGRYP